MGNDLLDEYTRVIWDWNGTLLDDLWLALDVANGMLSRRGLSTMDRLRYRDIFDFPVVSYYERAGFQFERKHFPVIADEFISEFNRRIGECSLHTGARDLLDDLHRRGVRQDILSASREEHLHDAVRRYDIVHFFHDVHGLSDHLAHSKTEVARTLIDHDRNPTDHTVMIGDTIHDFEVAEAMGIHCILVAGGHQSEERLRSTGTVVVPHLQSLF